VTFKSLQRCRAAILGWALLAAGFGATPVQGEPADSTRAQLEPREVHLSNLRQLTFGGENAEAYWSADGKQLILQSTRDGLECDQIFVMDVESARARMISTGRGRCTCSYFFPDGQRILYASTHLGGDACPPKPDYSKGYVWKLYRTFEIFTANPDGSGLRRITNHDGYDAEATVSPDGQRIVFTSLREGDVDLYSMKPDGSDVKRLTKELGYDGGAFYSHDGKRLVWRASRPKTPQEITAYKELLAEDTVHPTVLELYVGNADGSSPRQVTSNGAANFCPYFFPDDQRIVFASNQADPQGRNFDLWMIRDDGTGLERITFDPSFDGFPMFSPDGRRLAFASNRNGKARGETNIFVADWVENPATGSR
jgi:TolB protein